MDVKNGNEEEAAPAVQSGLNKNTIKDDIKKIIEQFKTNLQDIDALGRKAYLLQKYFKKADAVKYSGFIEHLENILETVDTLHDHKRKRQLRLDDIYEFNKICSDSNKKLTDLKTKFNNIVQGGKQNDDKFETQANLIIRLGNENNDDNEAEERTQLSKRLIIALRKYQRESCRKSNVKKGKGVFSEDRMDAINGILKDIDDKTKNAKTLRDSVQKIMDERVQSPFRFFFCRSKLRSNLEEALTLTNAPKTRK